MRTELPTNNCPGCAADGFSLVEVTIAIGLFAFVMVGILGLFPAATRMRADSALETRAVMIAQQLYSYVEVSGVEEEYPSFAVTFSVTNVALRDGPGLQEKNTRDGIDILNTGGVVLGYFNRSSMPYYFFGNDNSAAWTNMPVQVEDAEATTLENEITTLARVFAEEIPSGCHKYRVVVEVRSPASAPLLTPTGATNPAVRMARFVKHF